MSINAPTISTTVDNITHQRVSWFPSDINDELLFLASDINFGFVISALMLYTFVILTSLKSLNELANSFTDSGGGTIPIHDSRIVRHLKSKYATPLIIFANGVFGFCPAVLWLLMYFDVGGEAACDPLQRISICFYVLSLWTTYVLFEIRRIATGSENFKGFRYWIIKAVRISTMGVPAYVVVAYLTTSGIYLADVQHCVVFVNATSALLLGVGDGMLSMGHITVFLFAIRLKTKFKLTFVHNWLKTFSNKIKPSSPNGPMSPSLCLQSSIARLNFNLGLRQDNAACKLQAISKRNLRLALITIASTSISMFLATLFGFGSPVKESLDVRSYLYLRNISTAIGFADTMVNSISMLVMTSSWKPASLKRFSMKIATTVVRKHDKGSEVSSLGGS